jgi:hypothetical protein
VAPGPSQTLKTGTRQTAIALTRERCQSSLFTHPRPQGAGSCFAPAHRERETGKGIVCQTFKACRGHKASELICKLNPVLRGWANYHRHVVSSCIFGRIDHFLLPTLRHWIRGEHPNKSWRWIERRYFSAGPSGTFSVRVPGREGKMRVLSLYRLGKTQIERHIKVRAKANPYDSAYTEYFEKRRCFAWRTYPVGLFGAAARKKGRPAAQSCSPSET